MTKAEIRNDIYEYAKGSVEKRIENMSFQEFWNNSDQLEIELWSTIIYYGNGISQGNLTTREVIEIKETIWSGVKETIRERR